MNYRYRKRPGFLPFFFLFWLISLPFPPAISASPDNPGQSYEAILAAYEAFVTQQMKKDHVPGLSVAFQHGDFFWAKGFGYADLENDVPASAESAYRLASITKTITAVAILLLYEEGKLDLDDEVQKYVPSFPRKPWPITIRQLLGHLGGISHYRNYEVEGHIREPKTTEEALAIFKDFPLVAEPGTRYNYSTYGYNLLGAVLKLRPVFLMANLSNAIFLNPWV
jgi:CubicO group peptidase (beta-lactamase class C family)